MNRISSSEAFLQVWNYAILKARKRLLWSLLNMLSIRSLERKDSNCETKVRKEVFAGEVLLAILCRAEKIESGDIVYGKWKRKKYYVSWYSCEIFIFQIFMRGKPKHNIKLGKYRKTWDAMNAEICRRKKCSADLISI